MININNIVSPALNVLSDSKKIKLIRRGSKFTPESPTPVVTILEEIELTARLQPASTYEISQLHLDLQSFEYFKIYVSYDVTMLDKLRSFASDTFICDGNEYRMTAKMPWRESGWSEGICYLDKVKQPEKEEVTP